MKNFKCFPLFLSFLLVAFSSCKKEEVPTLITSAITNITGTSATSGGNISFDGGAVVLERGVCWSTANNPTILDNKTSDGSGEGNFSSDIYNLSGGTEYFVRAYATNEKGSGYGEALSFLTLGKLPMAKTKPATNVTPISATLNGVVNGNLLSTIVTFQYGTTTSYGQTITATQSPVNGDSLAVSANISGLTEGITYHFRVVALNSLGTANGYDAGFNSNIQPGKSYGGGLICHVDSTGIHGLISAPYDQSPGAPWYNGTYVTVGTPDADIGLGQSNTTKIVTIQGNGNYAAIICDDLVINGYDDWYLPSMFEIGRMYFNLHRQGLGNFTSNVEYWSSSESGVANHSSQFAMSNRFFSSYSMDTRDKSTLLYVRAMRSF